MKYFTYNDINKLRGNNKIIIIRKNIVYDFTDFIKKHPGGQKSIINNMFKNNQKNYKFHNKKSKKKWLMYKIGYIKKEFNKQESFCNIL